MVRPRPNEEEGRCDGGEERGATNDVARDLERAAPPLPSSFVGRREGCRVAWSRRLRFPPPLSSERACARARDPGVEEGAPTEEGAEVDETASFGHR